MRNAYTTKTTPRLRSCPLRLSGLVINGDTDGNLFLFISLPSPRAFTGVLLACRIHGQESWRFHIRNADFAKCHDKVLQKIENLPDMDIRCMQTGCDVPFGVAQPADSTCLTVRSGCWNYRSREAWVSRRAFYRKSYPLLERREVGRENAMKVMRAKKKLFKG